MYVFLRSSHCSKQSTPHKPLSLQQNMVPFLLCQRCHIHGTHYYGVSSRPMDQSYMAPNTIKNSPEWSASQFFSVPCYNSVKSFISTNVVMSISRVGGRVVAPPSFYLFFPPQNGFPIETMYLPWCISFLDSHLCTMSLKTTLLMLVFFLDSCHTQALFSPASTQVPFHNHVFYFKSQTSHKW
jgi:hypothetical protein